MRGACIYEKVSKRVQHHLRGSSGFKREPKPLVQVSKENQNHRFRVPERADIPVSGFKREQTLPQGSREADHEFEVYASRRSSSDTLNWLQ
jgi:hypothetical protein